MTFYLNNQSMTSEYPENSSVLHVVQESSCCTLEMSFSSYSNLCRAHKPPTDDFHLMINGGYYVSNSSGFTTFPIVPKNWKSQRLTCVCREHL